MQQYNLGMVNIWVNTYIVVVAAVIVSGNYFSFYNAGIKRNLW